MTDVYASRSELRQVLGGGTDSTIDDRLDLAILVGTAWVQHRVGLEVDMGDLSAPYTLAVVACPPAYKAATLAVAVRTYKSPDVPFGVMGAGEYAVRVQTSIPEADAILFGKREAFGFA